MAGDGNVVNVTCVGAWQYVRRSCSALDSVLGVLHLGIGEGGGEEGGH